MNTFLVCFNFSLMEIHPISWPIFTLESVNRAKKWWVYTWKNFPAWWGRSREPQDHPLYRKVCLSRFQHGKCLCYLLIKCPIKTMYSIFKQLVVNSSFGKYNEICILAPHLDTTLPYCLGSYWSTDFFDSTLCTHFRFACLWQYRSITMHRFLNRPTALSQLTVFYSISLENCKMCVKNVNGCVRMYNKQLLWIKENILTLKKCYIFINYVLQNESDDNLFSRNRTLLQCVGTQRMQLLCNVYVHVHM